MEKIDRLGWAAGISFRSYGWRIGVRVNKPEVMEQVTERLPPGWAPDDNPQVEYLYSFKVGGAGARPNVRQYTLLYSALRRVARTMEMDEALEALENDLQLFVGEYAKGRVFVHAGVVGWRGQALVLPGRSMSGKSSLVEALVRAGATYYSDEYAVLDERGNVYPYARRLSLRQPEGKCVRRCSVEELGGQAGSEALPVALVALTRYRADGQWRPRALTPGSAVLEMVAHTLPVQSQPGMAMNALRQVVVRARVIKTRRAEAVPTAQKLLRELGA